MQMSFQALLGVAENFTRLRSFMMKLYSTIVSFKLARWFLTKLLYLLSISIIIILIKTYLILKYYF
jgi:peroxin-13